LLVMSTLRATPPFALGYLGIGVSDPERWATFATDALGAEVVRDGQRVLVRTDAHDHRLALHPGGDALAYVGWEVGDRAHLDQLCSSLEAYGVDVTMGTEEECVRSRVRELAAFVDPGGLRHELFWGRQTMVSAPARMPSGVEFVDGIGHFVFFTEQSDAIRDLFVGALGFSISDFRQGAWFLRCNHRHHSMAVVQSSTSRMHHFMLEVGELDDVGRALDRAIDHGRLTRTIGRHSNDLTVSIYL